MQVHVLGIPVYRIPRNKGTLTDGSVAVDPSLQPSPDHLNHPGGLDRLTPDPAGLDGSNKSDKSPARGPELNRLNWTEFDQLNSHGESTWPIPSLIFLAGLTHTYNAVASG